MEHSCTRVENPGLVKGILTGGGVLIFQFYFIFVSFEKKNSDKGSRVYSPPHLLTPSPPPMPLCLEPALPCPCLFPSNCSLKQKQKKKRKKCPLKRNRGLNHFA